MLSETNSDQYQVFNVVHIAAPPNVKFQSITQGIGSKVLCFGGGYRLGGEKLNQIKQDQSVFVIFYASNAEECKSKSKIPEDEVVKLDQARWDDYWKDNRYSYFKTGEVYKIFYKSKQIGVATITETQSLYRLESLCSEEFEDVCFFNHRKKIPGLYLFPE